MHNKHIFNHVQISYTSANEVFHPTPNSRRWSFPPSESSRSDNKPLTVWSSFDWVTCQSDPSISSRKDDRWYMKTWYVKITFRKKDSGEHSMFQMAQTLVLPIILLLLLLLLLLPPPVQIVLPILILRTCTSVWWDHPMGAGVHATYCEYIYI